MEETIGDWWMDAGSKWHRGRPLAGWWQADDGRWHAPDDYDDYDDYDDDDPSGEIEFDAPAGAAHFAGGSPPPDLERGRGWPRWARRAVLASLAIVAVVAVGAAAIIGGDPDQNQAGTTTTVVAGDVVPSSPGAQVPQTTSTVDAASGSGVEDPSAPPTTERAPNTASTIDPSPTSAPPTSPPPSRAEVRPGAICSPEGATAVTAAGIPLTCTVEKCHGAPFDAPRWRRTIC
jgi:hypothetical protein